MTNAWFVGAMHSVPQDEDEVRSTVEPIRESGPAEADSAPDWNEFASDDSGELVGLAPRDLGSYTVDSVQSAPFYAPMASEDRTSLIDDQVASSGTAAARETAGQFGHGTMQYALGIEPVIREGAAFGADYFVANEMGANQGGGAFMTPDGTNNRAESMAAAAFAESQSRQAFTDVYQRFLEGIS